MTLSIAGKTNYKVLYSMILTFELEIFLRRIEIWRI